MNTARSARFASLLATASLLLAACASTPDTARHGGSEGSGFDVDTSYVEAVNRVSRETGVTVVWINPPRPGDRDD